MTETQEFKILLVDDRQPNLLSLEEALAAPNRSFIKASSGNDALKQVLRHPDIGLIMLDVQMPDMDGFEVARLLKSNPRTKSISVIFVTAINKEQQYVLKGFEEGAVDYLQKPLDLDVMLAKVLVFEKLWHYQQQLSAALDKTRQVNGQLEKFVYTVAHDIKSPLSGMIALLSVLTEDKNVNAHDRTRQYIHVLNQAAYHLADMVSGILEYSRKSLDEQEEEEVDTDVMVKDLWRLLFPPDHIHMKLGSTMPKLMTKKLKLMQVFQNLLSNAIKYNNSAEGLITIGCTEVDNFYRFSVKDNGPGIPEADQEAMFQLFQRGSNESTGDTSTGVGLNILRMLIEEQGGKIHIKSKVGYGTDISFDWKK